MIQNLQSRINGYRRKYASMRRWQKTIVFLAALVVFITTYALILPALTLENQTYCGYETGASEPVQVLTCTETDQEHVHQASCYELQSAAEGGTPVHEHTLQCFSNPDADVENTGIWEQMASAVNLTGVKNEDLVTMARSQLGYTESEQNYQVADDNTTMNGYTRYGDWCGDPYADWNAAFCAFCLNYAGIDESVMPRKENCQEWMDALREKNLFADASHTPGSGNLVFIDQNGDGKADQMGIVDQSENPDAAQFRTIQGDVENSVRYVDYQKDDVGILGYGILEGTEEVSEPAAAEMEPAADQGIRSSARRLLAGAAPSPLAETDASDKYDMTQYITTVNIQHRRTNDDIWENIQNGTVNTGDQLRFDISYELPEKTLDVQNRTIHYQVPDKFEIIKADTGTVKDGSGAAVGDYVIAENGSVSITFYEDYAKKNADGSKINGHIAFESSVDDIKKNDDGSITIPFKEEIRIEVKDLYGDIKVEKKSSNVDTFRGTLKYTITITSQTGTGEQVVLKDTPTNVERTGDLHIVDQNGNAVTNFSVSEDGNTITLPKMNRDGKDKYIITYDAKLTSDAMKTLETPNSNHVYPNVKGTNKAEVFSKDSEGQIISYPSIAENTFTRNIMSKSGEYKSENGYVDWTIKINSNSATRVDLSGWKLSDDFDNHVLDPSIEVTISPNPATGSGSIKTHLSYTFPNNSSKTTYTITYRTEGNDKSKNRATLTPPDGSGIGTGDVTPKSLEVKKTALSQDIIGTDDSGNVLVEQKWNVNVTASMVVQPNNNTNNVAGVSSSNTKVFPNGGYWEILDQISSPGKVRYFTLDQATANAERMAKALWDAGYKEGNYYIFAYDPTKGKNRLIKRSEGSDTYYNNASSWKSATPQSDDRYDRMYIVADSDWTPTQSISFDVINTLNAGNHESSVSTKNVATCQNANFVISSNATQTYTPVLSKYDYRYVDNKATGIKPTEHSLEDVMADALQWEIAITLPKDVDYTKEVIITDTVPEGTHILSSTTDTSKKQSVCFAGPSTKGIFGEGGHVPIPYNGSWSVKNLKANAENGKGTLTQTSPAGTMSYELNSTRAHAEKDAFDQVVLKIPADLANRLRGYTFYLVIFAYPDNYDFVEKSYNNEVTIAYKNDVFDRASQEQTVKAKAIQKGVVKDSGSTKLHEDKTIPYVICVNPTGADLVAGTNDLTVSDELSYVMPANGTVNVALNSIRVFKGTANCNVNTFKQIVDDMNSSSKSYKEKMDALNQALTGESKTLEEISDSCPYTIKESTEGGKIVYTYNAKVPDGEKLLLLYDYKFSGSGRLTNVTNKASVYGLGSSTSSDSEKIDITVQQSSADAVLVGVNVYKVDSKNYAVHLNGAKFILEMWNGSSWEQVGQTFETNEKDGFFNTGKLQDNTAYKLTETEAPKGYEMKTPTVYEFYIRNTAPDAHQECKPSGFEGKALNNGDEILIPNDLITYELPHTGGMGAAPYVLCGMAVMAIAAAFGLRRKFSRER